MKFRKEFEIYSPNINQFFGYYDRPQCNSSGQYLFCRGQEQFSKFDICVYDSLSGEVSSVSKSDAVGYQLGNLNSWVSENQILIHKKIEETVVAEIVNVKSSQIELSFERACYVVKDGLGVFFNIENSGLDRKSYGLGSTKKSSSSVSIYDIHHKAPVSELSESQIDTKLGTDKHWYMEHCCFLNSESLLMLFRTSLALDGIKVEELMVWNYVSGTFTKFFNFSKISHFYGSDNAAMLFGSRNAIGKKNWLKKIVKSFPYSDLLRKNQKLRAKVIGESYWRLVDSGLERVPFFRDGHPTRVLSGYVYDTYETNDNTRELYYLDDESHVPERIECVPSCSLTDGTPIRTDLHPRAIPSGKGFTIDFIRDGVRGFAYYSLAV